MGSRPETRRAGSQQKCPASPVPPLSAPSWPLTWAAAAGGHDAEGVPGRRRWAGAGARAPAPAQVPESGRRPGMRVAVGEACPGDAQGADRGAPVCRAFRSRPWSPPQTLSRVRASLQPGVQPWVQATGLLGKFSQAARDGGPQPQATQNGGRAGLRGTFQGLRGRGLGPGLLRQPPPPPQQSENSCLLTPRGGAAHLCGWQGGGLRAGAGQGPRLHSLP